VTVLTDEERKQQQLADPDHRIDPFKFPKLDFVFPHNTKDFDHIPIEFQGYCGYHLTANDRLLVPVVPEIGLFQYNGRFYGFSSRDSAEHFVQSPDSYFSAAIEVSKKSPELIQLLDMHVHFASGTPGSKVVQDDVIKAPVTKCDSGTQTDTHFMESNIVRSYEWNEWELRRKAIKLVSKFNHFITSPCL
jgi:hypothetical protein